MHEMTTDLFDEFCSDVLCIEGLGLKYKGAAITHIAKNDDDQVTFWSGDPGDNFSEQILLDTKTEREYLNEIEAML